MALVQTESAMVSRGYPPAQVFRRGHTDGPTAPAGAFQTNTDGTACFFYGTGGRLVGFPRFVHGHECPRQSMARSWGAGTPRRFFRGLIDEVDFFASALSDADVQSIFNAGSAGKCQPGQ